MEIQKWAEEQATSLLSSLGNRWLHVQGVVEQAKWVSAIFNEEEDKNLLIAAAYLHDIGYAPSLQKTGFHPIDGACYLRSCNQYRLASLVAYHSESTFEAELRGILPELKKIPREHSLIADALTYCDMTTNGDGKQVSFQERLDDIFSRYDPNHIVYKAIKAAAPALTLGVRHTEQALYQKGLISKT
ncbi:HD domain-containing protein [Dictyobacter aurantiacus]|uniref:Metal-dependent phosphohydrolase, HD subdomain protein n=1 Tax=Dictyobacter aurantiacus TaxID=1936993 RepID=A0A401ZD31_9CHLR|nr:HD domain-containing protein [Dictyobacter aurantiacus]GCE04787.1 metal-dependent phosphohydrolase, HD subdomain protein [Dictyobacter aurantiacus]